MRGRRVLYEQRAAEEPASRSSAADLHTYLCRLRTVQQDAPPQEVRVKAAGYEEAIDQAIGAFLSDPQFTPPTQRATIHAYMVTANRIHEEDAAFRFIQPGDWN